MSYGGHVSFYLTMQRRRLGNKMSPDAPTIDDHSRKRRALMAMNKLGRQKAEPNRIKPNPNQNLL